MQDRTAAIFRRTVLTAAGATVLAGAVRAQGAARVIDTTGGRVRGDVGDGIHRFKGIPYAASTAGANRFLPPVAAEPWAGVRDATAFGHSAAQVPRTADPLGDWYGALEPISEDCLSLNVFTPATDARKRPVMVWLHGGAWASCAGSAPGFDGTQLARNGDVVVVTVNHRLNLFGYIKLDDADARFADSGNAGVLDMVAALRWVRDNIGHFGGDAGNVTIFGQSGGGAKVSALLAMPAANGLFHKAIAQSCSGSLRLTGEAEAAKLTHALAAQLGIEVATGAALQAVPVEHLVAALAAQPRMFRPVLDGRNFRQNPFDPAAPTISADVPVMFGNAATEATLYMAVDRRNFSLPEDEVRRRVGRFLQIDAVATGRVMDAYRAAAPAATPSELLGNIATDFTYRRNTTREAALQSAAARAPVYAYVFDWRTPVMDGLLRTPHTAEVPFVFGTSSAAVNLVGSGPDLPILTRTLTATWAAFAHTGNPNNPHVPHWPAYEATARSTMMLKVQSEVAGNPGGDARASLDPIPVFEYSMPVNYPRA